MGIYMTGADSNNTFSNNDLSGNAYGIADAYGIPRPGNIYTNNDLSDSSSWGMAP